MQTTARSDMAADTGVATLKSSFLAALPADERAHIFDLSARTIQTLDAWVARYPLIRRVRVLPLCLSLAAAAPFCSAASLGLIARMNLWVGILDDLIDEELAPSAQLQQRIERCHQILDTGQAAPEDADDQLSAALYDIRSELAGYPLFPRLELRWARGISQTMRGMLVEDAWRAAYRTTTDTSSLPTYAAYLEQGISTIAAACMGTVLIVIDDQSTMAHLRHLDQVIYEVSLCLRLANDLRSHAKELQEGKLNAVIIRQRDLIARGIAAESAEAQARASIQATIQQGLARCTELQSCGSTATGQPEQMMIGIARFACDFYIHHDYHTFATGSEDREAD